MQKYNTAKAATRDVGNEYVDLMAADENLYVVNADLSDSLKIRKAKNAYPGRTIEMGISEQDMISFSYGLALMGKKVIVNTFAQFMQRGWDQIYQSGRGKKLNIIYRATHAGIGVGQDGESAQAIGDLGAMRANAGIDYVLDPVDYNEAVELLRQLLQENRTAYMRTYRQPVSPLLPQNYEPKIGRGFLFPQNINSSIIIIASGSMLEQALKAQSLLESSGIKIKVAALSTIKPSPDAGEVKRLVENSNLVITAEDHLKYGGGLGDALAPALNKLGIRQKRIGMDSYGTTGTPEGLYKKYGMDAEGITRQVKEFLNK
ncbi:MAG: transketolase C-terminal domain-containing protein [Candidatus Aenigmatarchaeota archaeon]